MHNGEAITQLLPTMKAFPEPSDIFVPEQSWLAKHFLPLLSIDLGELHPELAGTVVHMLNPIEPFDGNIGEDTEEFHNEYCGENFYAFRLTDDNRYEFLADEGYFLRSDIHQDKIDEFDEEDAQETIDSYFEMKENFQETGKISNQAFLSSFGGSIDYGNWTNSFESYQNHFPLKNTFYRFERNENGDAQIFYKDEPFFQVGWTAGYHWCNQGADAIEMLYEPKNRIVLFSLDWS